MRKYLLILFFTAVLVLPNPLQTVSYENGPTVFELKELAENWADVADLFWAEREYEKALYFSQKSLAAFPSERSLWTSFRVYSLKQDYFNAYITLADLEQIGNIHAIGQRGYIKMRQNRYSESIPDLRRYKSLNGSSSYLRAWLIDHYIGMAYHQVGNYEEAIAYYDSCIREEGEEWTVVYNFLYKGMALEALGRTEEALLAYEKINSLCSICPEGYYFQGELLRELEDYTSAQHAYEEAYNLRHNVYAFNWISELDTEDIEKQWLMYGKRLVYADGSY